MSLSSPRNSNFDSSSTKNDKEDRERKRSQSRERTRKRRRSRWKLEEEDDDSISRHTNEDKHRKSGERTRRERGRRRRRKRRSRSRSRSRNGRDDRGSSPSAASRDATHLPPATIENEHADKASSSASSIHRQRSGGEHGGRNEMRESTADPRWGKKEEYEAEEKLRKEREEIEKEKANFGLTGNLMEDEDTGAMVNGVKLKWSQPLDSRPPTRRWRLYVFKGSKQLETLHIHRQASYLVGRDERVADIQAHHPSISSQHAVIQFRLQESRDLKSGQVTRQVKPYVMDLESTNGTMINKQKIEPARYTELRERDLINFGVSTRDYVLLHEHTKVG